MAKATKAEVAAMINKLSKAQLEAAVVAMRAQPAKFAPEFVNVFVLAAAEKTK
jgi:hypothetical protein